MRLDQRQGLEELATRCRLPNPIFVTQPNMPPLEDYHRLLEKIWESRWLTNDGTFHQEFERRLSAYLGVEHVNLFCNGTIALLVALHALRLDGGEIITTPFTFPATVHVCYWNRIRPVFCDIDPTTFNLDPKRIEQLIGPDTKAIMPVHVYGTPCDVDAIQGIADRHGLHVIYDAAHTFGALHRGQAVAKHGEISMLSFHATKLFSTIEGGALVVASDVLKKRINFLKNFGIASEVEVLGPGINGKMNEFQAAYGLLQLDMVDDEIARRAAIAGLYRERLEGVPGITLLGDAPATQRNFAYYPILIEASSFGISRDELHELLKAANVVTRRYFYPLCSRYPSYSGLPSAQPEQLPVAERVAQEVLCLPIYGALAVETAERICALIVELHEQALRACRA